MSKKRRAQLVYAPPPPKRKKGEGSYWTVKGSIKRGVDYEFAAAAGAKSKYRGLWCFENPWGPSWAVPVETPQGVKPPPVDVVAGATPGFEDREPYFIFRSIRSEVEAALLRDIATLWVKLHEKGCTPAKLQAVEWNLPCMELWKEESGALKPLQRAMPPEQAKVRTTIRRLTRELLLDLPKGLVPQYALLERKALEERRAAAEKKSQEWEAERAAEAQRWAAVTEAFWEKQAEKQRRAEEAEAARVQAIEAARAKAEAQREWEAGAPARAAHARKAAVAAQSEARAARMAARAGKRG